MYCEVVIPARVALSTSLDLTPLPPLSLSKTVFLSRHQ